jgi:formylglycine-generating enzyme required for sulfatase activity
MKKRNNLWQAIQNIAIIAIIVIIGFVALACDNGDNHVCSFGEWSEKTAATCITSKVEERVCSCGETDTRTVGDPLGTAHSYGEWTTKTEATCIAAKVEKRTCALCEDEDTRIVGEPLGHKPGAAATCTVPQTCIVCEYVLQAAAHTFVNGICTQSECLMIEMVQVTGGTFTMGPDIWNNNATVSVTLSNFSIAKYTVTQELYERVMETNPSYFTTSNGRPPETGETDKKRPVETVNWYHAIAFCNRLSILEGLTPVYSIDGISSSDADAWLHSAVPTSSNATWNAATANWSASGYRLPTDAQWEFAAKGGNSSNGYTYSGSDNVDDIAWYSGNSGSKTHEVGKKAPNELGLYDMSGNVWEWCWDWYGNYPTEAQNDPTGAVSGTGRVDRGGSWINSAELSRSVSRLYGIPRIWYDDLGFRLVR